MGEVSLNDYTMIWPGYEQSFNAPFAVVNAAVFHVLMTWAAQRPTHLPREETTGATRYMVRLNTGDHIGIYVLQRGEGVTTISLHHLKPREEPYMLGTITVQQVINVLNRACEEVTRAIRYTNPQFTRRPVEIAPPCPQLSEGWDSIFTWQGIYARDIGDKELADLLGVSHKTVRNARTRHQQPKRTPRGKPRT